MNFLRPLTTAERLEMENLMIQLTMPITKTRAKLQQRYGKKAKIELPGAAGAEITDLVLPPKIAEVDSDLVRLEGRVREAVLKEYGQLDMTPDPEDEFAI